VTERMREDIIKQSMLFKSPNLSEFQEKVNSAAAQLALHNPSLVHKGNRGTLLERARRKVADDGYLFKKGKSRSKVYGEQSCTPSSPPKRRKLNEQMRAERLNELAEDVESVGSRVAIKEKCLAQAEAVRNYKLCDQLCEEIQELKSVKRAKSRELVILQQKETRANRYRYSRSSRSVTPVSTPDLVSSPVSPLLTTSPASSLREVSPSSPLFVPKHTDEGCTSFEESALESESVVDDRSQCQNL